LYLNRGVRSIFFALKPGSTPALAVDQLAYILEREEAKTLIKIDFDNEKVILALKASENILHRVRLFYPFFQ
jgi:hypothetical protein